MAATACLEQPPPRARLRWGRRHRGCMSQSTGAGKRREPCLRPSWRGGSPTLPGTAAASQPQLQTRAFLCSRGPRNPPCPSRLESASFCYLDSPCSQQPLRFQSKVEADPGCCHDPTGCVHAQGGSDKAVPCRLSPLWALGADKYRREVTPPYKPAGTPPYKQPGLHR